MSMVDNRVVKMTFDNSEFEKKIKSTMETLSKFEESLKMDGAAAGFDKIKAAADQLNLSALGEKVKEEASKIGLASSEASSSIGEIDDAAQNADFSQLSNAAEDAVADINSAASQTDLSPVVDAAEDAAEGFNMLEAVATGVLIGIGNQIAMFATNTLGGLGNKIKEFTIQPMIDGFKEYETQMGSIQTIMANTGLNFSADEDIALVNSRLDELNEYADLTIYNFTEMTRNIGTFTAAGVDLDTSVSAIKGIANLAALSGSNSQQASTAMYQLSQALAAGTLKLQDWNSVVNAGMGGEVFQNALKETARAHGVAVDEIIEANGSFRESLQEGWITSEILTETLNHMAISYKQVGDEAYNAALEEMVANGYTEEQAVEILRLAKVAEQSATKVRTWTQLWDTVKESIGSQWSQIWRNFIGDFKQATDTFTFLSNSISSGVESLFSGLIRASKAFQKSGAFDVIFGGYKKNKKGDDVYDEVTGELIRIKGALDYIIEAIAKPLNAIKTAFDDIFEITWKDLKLTILTLSLAFKDFAQSLVISDIAALGVHRIFEGLFSILKIGFQIVTDLVGIFFGLVGILRQIIDPIIDIVLVLGGQFGKVLAWVEDRFQEVREAILLAFEPLADAATTVMDVIAVFLGLEPMSQQVANVGDAFVDLLDKIWKLIDLPGIIGKIGDGIKGILDLIAGLTGWTDAIKQADEAVENGEKNVSVLEIYVQNLLKHPVAKFFFDIYEALKGIPAQLIEFIDSIVDLFTTTEKGSEEANEKVDIFAKTFEIFSIIVTKAFGIIEGALELIVSILSPIVDFIGTAVSAIGDFIRNNIVGAVTTLTSVLGFLFEVISTIATFIGTVVKTVLGVVVVLLTGIFNIVKPIALFIKDVVVIAITTLFNVFGFLIELFKIVGPLLQGTVLFVFNNLWTMAVKIATALGNLIGKIKDFILSWKPVQDLLKIIDDFKNAVLGFFTKDLNSNIGEASGNIVKYSDTVRGTITKIRDKIESFVQYLNNVTPDQLVKDIVDKIGSIKDAIANKIEEVFSLIIHFNPKNAFAVLLQNLENVREKMYDILDSIFDWLDETFPEFSETFEEVYDIIFNVITGIFDGIQTLMNAIGGPLMSAFGMIRNFVQTLRNNADDIPSFIANLLGLIIIIVIHAVGSLLDILGDLIFLAGIVIVVTVAKLLNAIIKSVEAIFTGKGLSGVKDAFGEFGSNIVNTLKEKLEGISPAFKTAFDKIDEFFNKSKDGSRTWKDSLLDAFDTFIDYLKEIPGKLASIFNKVKDNIANAFSSILNTLADMKGPVGDIFKSIKDKMDAAKNKTQKTAEEIPSAFDTIVNKVKEAAKKMYSAVKEFFFGPEEIVEGASESISSIGDAGGKAAPGIAKITEVGSKENGGIFGTILSFFGDVSSPIIDKLKNIPKFVGDIINSIAENITLDNVYKVVSILGAISKVKLYSGLGNFFKGAGKLTKAIAKKIDKEEGGSIRDKLRDLALTFAIIGATLWVISTIEDPWQCVLILAAVEGVLIVADTIASFLTKKFGNGGSELLAASLSVAALSVGILIMLKAIEALNAFDFGANLKGLILFGVILVVLSGIAILISHFGGNNAGTGMLAASASLMIMALAVRMMIGPIETICEFAKTMNADELKKSGEALAAVALFMIAMGASLRLAGDHAIAAGIGFVLMGLAVETICEALTSIIIAAMLDWDAVKNSFMMLFVLIGEFALIAKYVDDGSLIKAGIAIVLFSAGVSLISDAIVELSNVAGNNWESVKNSFMILFVMIGEFALIAKYVDDGSLVKAGVAVALFSAGVLILSAAISVLAESDGDIQTATLALAAMVSVFGLFALVISAIPGSEAVLVSLGIAFVAFGAACLLISVALQNTVDAIMKLALGTPLLVAFAKAISQNLTQFVQAAVALGALGIAFAIFGPTSIIAGAGMMVLAAGMNMMSTAIPGLLAGIPALVSFVTIITQHVAQFAIAAVGLAAIGAALLIFGPGAIAAGLGLTLLSIGIREFLVLIIQLPALLQAAGTSIGVLLQMLPEALSSLWENISTWWLTVAWPKIQEVGGLILQKLTEFKDRFVEWWTTTAWPAIQEKLGQFWEWFQTTALPKLQEIGSMLLQKFGEFKDKFVEWWTTTAWPTIKQKAGEIFEWFKTEGIPKLKEIGKTIFSKLGEALSKFATWVVNDALPAVGNGIKDIVNKAKETFGPKIEEFINGIPNTISNFFSGIWDQLTRIGSDIIAGIAEGITNFDAQSAIDNAIQIMSSWVPQGVKDFFNMASPSKLMRDEIGPYIPMGLAVGMEKYGYVVKEAAYEMGDNAVSGVQKSLDRADYRLPSPSISPVMNMGSFDDDISSYNRLLRDSMIDSDLTTNNRFSGEMSLSADLASKLDADINKMGSINSSINDIRQAIYDNANKTQELYSRTNAILDSLSTDASAIKDRVEMNRDIYMDSGALVGAIAPEMDRALGWRTALAERGVY